MFKSKRDLEAFIPRHGCAECGRTLTIISFSLDEWKKGDGVSVCNDCTKAVHARRTARCNQANAAEYDDEDLDKPFAAGSFRFAAKGVYIDGERKGQPCVCKWFKKRGGIESDYFDTDLVTANEAIRLIAEWNAKKFINREVRVNLPEVWTFDSSSTRGWAGRKVMQEPFIENYEKFNSNNGWNNDTFPWARAMQALSHFSYHTSNGKSLLCDLQGGVYRSGVILTDPAIMSPNRTYGPTDLGEKGISSFFARHVCNEFCRPGWLRPRDQHRYYQRRRGSTMEHISSKMSRPNMSLAERTANKRPRHSVSMAAVSEEEDEEEEWKEGDE